ncbi:MAG: Na-K-Cl cotransporter [Myxococcota bacterium]
MAPATTAAPSSANAASAAKRFGAFGGVFTPSILTILGVVMYLRFGWVTGQAGLGGALIVVGVSHLISLATGLSVASIATNRTVGPGGAYFMISRSLGAPAGAAIGIPLFFAQALSATFYIVGFTEALMHIVPAEVAARVGLSPHWLAVAIGTGVNVLLTALSFKSAALAIKAQYVVMGTIALSLVSFFMGTTPQFPVRIEWFNPEGEGFAKVFAVFFPAVTGIMAGVSMSGDLKDPRSAIPRGTLAAILTGMVVYVAFPIWLALNASNADLVADLDVVWNIAAAPSLIYLGVWGATLSSAIGSILTAPRTLQALANDGLVPRLFGRGSGPSNEPRVGLAATFLLAQAGILLGSLDVIAPVLTMFFLATYGMINLASGLERWAASPSFRPTFRVPAWVSLAGGVACFYVMSVIDMAAMVAALVLCGVIFVAQERRALGTTFGDARHGMWAALVRSSLHRLRRTDWHPLNWRPNLVILGGPPQRRPHLLHLGSAVVQDRGIVTYFHLIRGAVPEKAGDRRELFETYDRQFADRFPHVFYRVDIVDDIYRGTVQIAQTYGVGMFEANSVMLGWPNKPERAEAYVQMLRDLVALDRSLLLVRHDGRNRMDGGREIQVWWGGLHGNGGLMLLLCFLLTAHHRWRNAAVKVCTVVESEREQEEVRRRLEEVLRDARLEATPIVLMRQGRSIREVMHEEAQTADLAIVGFRLPEEGEPAEPFFERMNSLLEILPTTLIVHSARHFESEPVLFDS